MSHRSRTRQAGERKRDEARQDHHASFAAGEWEISDQREPDERFGKSRSDGGAPAGEYVKVDDKDAAEATFEEGRDDTREDDDRDTEIGDEPDDDPTMTAEHEGSLESSANPSGMGRGDKPHKAVRRGTSEPHAKARKTASKKSSAKKSSEKSSPTKKASKKQR